MKRRILLLLTAAAISVLLCQGTAPLHAIDKKPLKDVNVDALTGETQKTLGNSDSINIVWVIPIEFWQASLAQDKTLPEGQRQAFLSALSKYLMLGVVRADITPLGGMRFHDEKKVFRTLNASLVKGKGEPVPLKLLLRADDDDAQLVINSMKPFLKAALGKMGDNFHLFVCINRDEAGRRLVSPYETSKVRVGLGAIGPNKGGTLEFDFPLDSLHVPRRCAGCGKEAHITWSYCPFCGKKHAR
jgi:hypothetical protein